MDSAAFLRLQFDEAAATLQQARALQPGILAAAELMAGCFAREGTLMICGNGGSAADAQHFAAELTGRFEQERPGKRAIALHADTSALTAIANDYGFEQVFRRQVEAMGRPGDCLVAISTSGNSRNVIEAVKEAGKRQIQTLGLLGRDGGQLMDLCDLVITVNHPRTARIQEIHGLIIHCWCALLDAEL